MNDFYKSLQNFPKLLHSYYTSFWYNQISKKVLSCRDNYRDNFRLFPYMSDLHSYNNVHENLQVKPAKKKLIGFLKHESGKEKNELFLGKTVYNSWQVFWKLTHFLTTIITKWEWYDTFKNDWKGDILIEISFSDKIHP